MTRQVGKRVIGGLASCLLLVAALVYSKTALFSVSEGASQTYQLSSKDNFVQESADIAQMSANCAGKEHYICHNSPWVFCTDAICETPVAGIAKCVCWKQAKGMSVLPQEGQGAGCMTKKKDGGEAMCKAMQAGKLYSTFSPHNTSYYPPRAFIECPPKMPFAYCWGASCIQDPDHEQNAICDCPMMVSPFPGNTFLTIEKKECSSSNKVDLCKGATLNSIPDMTGKTACLTFTEKD